MYLYKNLWLAYEMCFYIIFFYGYFVCFGKRSKFAKRVWSVKQYCVIAYNRYYDNQFKKRLYQTSLVRQSFRQHLYNLLFKQNDNENNYNRWWTTLQDLLPALLEPHQAIATTVCFDSIDKAIKGIETLHLDIVFLDVQLQGKNRIWCAFVRFPP